MSPWFVDQKSVDTIPIDDRAAQYGDGLFETIAIRGSTPRFWTLHLDRLQQGCERLGIDAPPAETLQEALAAAIIACDIDTDFAVARITISAGTGPRGYRRPTDAQTSFRIGIFESQALPATAYRDGVETRLCRTRLAIQTQLAGIKTINRLEQVLARAEWNDASIVEGLMLDTEDRLICGTMSNVFVTSGKTIATPAITRCGVAGIMRRHVLTLLEHARIACDVRDIELSELQAADEVFLTNSQFGILPVTRCAGQAWSVGRMTQQVMTLAAGNGVPECAP